MWDRTNRGGWRAFLRHGGKFVHVSRAPVDVTDADGVVRVVWPKGLTYRRPEPKPESRRDVIRFASRAGHPGKLYAKYAVQARVAYNQLAAVEHARRRFATKTKETTT